MRTVASIFYLFNAVLKKLYFFRAFIVRSQCVHREFTVRSLVFSAHLRSVRAHRSQWAHRVLNVCSQSVYVVFTVRSAFTYRSVRFHSFSFETPKLKDRSLQVTAKREQNSCVKGSELILHIKHHFTRNLIRRI